MFKNFGSSGQKFTFQIDVRRVVLPDMLEHFEGTETLAVSLERKNYPVLFTRDAPITLNDEDEIVAEWAEPLVTHATMFKDGRTGLYKEKTAKLNVLQRRAGYAGVSATLSAFKSLGMATLPLHVYADSVAHGTASGIKLHLTWCASEKAYLIADISAVPGDVSGDLRSETGSVDDNRSDSGSVTGSITGSLRSGTGSVRGTASLSSLSVPISASARERQRVRGVSTIREEEEGIDEDAANDPFARHVHFTTSDRPQPQSESLSQSDNRLSSSVPGPLSAPVSVPLSAPAPVYPTAPVVSGVGVTSREDLLFSESALYRTMKERLNSLEDALLTSQDVVSFEKQRAREATQLAARVEEQCNGRERDREEEREREREEARRENETLSLSLSQCRSEGARLQALVSRSSEELTSLRAENERLQRAVRDKNDECEALLQELIATKMTVGELSAELDETKKELRALKAAREKALEARRARETNGPHPPLPLNSGPSSVTSSGVPPPRVPNVPSSGNLAQNYAQGTPTAYGNTTNNTGSNYANNGGFAQEPNFQANSRSFAAVERANNAGNYNAPRENAFSTPSNSNNNNFNTYSNANNSSNYSLHSNGNSGHGSANNNNNNNTSNFSSYSGNNNNNNNNTSSGRGGTAGNNNNNPNAGGSAVSSSGSGRERVNPFAQMGSNVGSTLLRGFNSVSSALADAASTPSASSNSSAAGSAVRRNPPPRPTF